ncbi:hypothetical protein PMZ80_010212 [Knufia obscura]|uniref:Kinesin motor domain-containing protein n=2 Tax=Knufia TaxID=430999 RepID=A0AAN8ESZ5_9EURO|nr:hypothetical protein PMZ80_010212 [Knufia obscura]KAK5952951.1 hypothetical protein OHC33_006072 [Knufia fluminis]
MSVRVVARIRPLLKAEAEKDQILSIHEANNGKPQIVKIPNPKSQHEEYSFNFAAAYDATCTQQELFDTEVAPTIKHLFQGFDVTLFAYGVTGSGKTHTMRGGKSLADRGMIPRLLSNIYRKSKALEKASNGETSINVSMSYYEIYTDKVFDLFEPPEKRTPTGLPIREAEGGKTVVAGLSEVPCSSLKEFEILYDKANANRSVGSTKLNAESSRSHAILCVKVTISTATETRASTICAIDLAGSEDNRRTGNVKERMVESASINKSLFVLAQCVEAISKKQSRIPYRESKMTRILSLGQNNGLTVMILNLPPTKAFHLDTLSSLNFANRTKKVEVREIENEPIFRGPPRPPTAATTNGGMARQPLRPLNSAAANANILANREAKVDKEKPAKLFSVYADKSKTTATGTARSIPQISSPLKRSAVDTLPSSRPAKQSRPATSNTSLLRRGPPETTTITKATLDSLVEKKVAEILAAREANVAAPQPVVQEQHATEREKAISAEVQARLDSIEKRLEGQEGERAEGLSYLFMAKQHQARGEDEDALKMYELAQPFFPDNQKLERKVEKLRAKLSARRPPGRKSEDEEAEGMVETDAETQPIRRRKKSRRQEVQNTDQSYQVDDQEASYQVDHREDAGYSDHESPRPRKKASKHTTKSRSRTAVRADSPDPLVDRDDQEAEHSSTAMATPRTQYLIDILNLRNVSKLKALNGLGVKKAEAIVQHLQEEEDLQLTSWHDVLNLDVRGIGKRSWEVMREGVLA